MPKTRIDIRRPLGVIWDFLTERTNWREWWGGDLREVSPGWQEGAVLVWASGDKSTLSEFAPRGLLQFSTMFMQTTFRLTPTGEQSTAVEVEFSPQGGAAFSDGGAAQKQDLASSLAKLKDLVESGG